MNFLTSFAPQISWAAGVLTVAAILQFVARSIFRRVRRRDRQRAKSQVHLLTLIHGLIVAFIWLAAALLLSYLAFDQDSYGLVTRNLLRVCWFFAVAVTTLVAANTVGRTIERAESHGDRTTLGFLKNVIVAGVYLLGAILCALAIPGLKTVAQSALAGAGVLAVVAGLASQDALSNLVGGLLIVIFRPFQLEDLIKVSGELGVVEDITLRHTIIRNAQNQRIVVPNAAINKETLINYHMVDQCVCMWIEVGVGYDTVIDDARAVMADCCARHPTALDRRDDEAKARGDPQIPVRVIQLGDSSITLRAWVWAENQDAGFLMRCDLYEQVSVAFNTNGIEIPFPQRTVTFRSPEPQTAATSPN